MLISALIAFIAILLVRLHNTKNKLEASNRNFNHLATTLLSGVLTKYLEGTEFTNHLVSIKYNELKIMIGDEENMVQIEPEELEKGIDVAVNNAMSRLYKLREDDF